VLFSGRVRREQPAGTRGGEGERDARARLRAIVTVNSATMAKLPADSIRASTARAASLAPRRVTAVRSGERAIDRSIDRRGAPRSADSAFPAARCNEVCSCSRAVPPSKPIILDGATRSVWSIEKGYNEGSDVNLICEVRGGRPPPKLTWYLDNTVIDESYHYNSETGMTVNHLAYPKIGRQHLKARLICQAGNTNLVQPQTRLLILDVKRKCEPPALPLALPLARQNRRFDGASATKKRAFTAADNRHARDSFSGPGSSLNRWTFDKINFRVERFSADQTVRRADQTLG